jgi:hydroxymethylpyrimidine/phosphomethylpyrimidine kinase
MSDWSARSWTASATPFARQRDRNRPMTPRILAIAGSDSGGGAGIQADIKTITMLGGHAMTAVTAVTAQNTLGVQSVLGLPAELVEAQVAAVVSDIGVDAVKVGMLATPRLVVAVRDILCAIGAPIVIDPVMVATSGDSLIEQGTAAVLSTLLPMAALITPNTPELAALTGQDIADENRMAEAAKLLAEQHNTEVLAKGGHLSGATVVDLLVSPGGVVARWESARIDTRHDHGTGCTLSSAIATGLGQGVTLVEAVSRARAYVRAAMEAAPGLGAGHGPMGHGLGRAYSRP